LHSTNPLERLNKKVKRRADVIGIFPNEDAIVRLIGAVLFEQNDGWQSQHRAEERIGYTLLWGENGPKHADAWASFDEQDGTTTVTLGMVFSTAAEFQEAKGFGAVELGLQTLGKLARFVGAE